MNDELPRLDRGFDLLSRFIDALSEGVRDLMTLADDTKAAEAQLQADVTSAISAIQAGSTALRTQIAQLEAQLAAQAPISTADLQTLHDNLVAIDSQVTSAAKNLTPVTPVTPVVPPA